MSWQNKLKQVFEKSTGLSLDSEPVLPGTAIERTLTERLTRLKLTEKAYEPEETLVIGVMMGTSPGAPTEQIGGEMHKLAMKISLASLPGKSVVQVCHEFPELNEDKLYLPGEWGIVPTDVKFAKAIGYTKIESFSKSLGLRHANRPYTRAQVEGGRKLILVETDKSFQIWAQPIQEVNPWKVKDELVIAKALPV